MSNEPQKTEWCPAHGYPLPCAKCGYSNLNIREEIASWLHAKIVETRNSTRRVENLWEFPIIEWTDLEERTKEGWRKEADALLPLVGKLVEQEREALRKEGIKTVVEWVEKNKYSTRFPAEDGGDFWSVDYSDWLPKLKAWGVQQEGKG